ncbi:hypothetical protein F-E9_279 [Faustovirus]|nr:hypothetical protein F-E9_279 [Faustovirus]
MSLSNVRLTNIYSKAGHIGYKTVSYLKPQTIISAGPIESINISTAKPLKTYSHKRQNTGPPTRVTQHRFDIRGMPILCLSTDTSKYIPRSQLLALMGHDSSTYYSFGKHFDSLTAADLAITSANIDRKTLFVELKCAFELLTSDDEMATSSRRHIESERIAKLIKRHKSIHKIIKYALTLQPIDIELPKQLRDLPTITIEYPNTTNENTIQDTDSSADSTDSREEDVREVTRKSPLAAAEAPIVIEDTNTIAALSIEDREQIAAESVAQLATPQQPTPQAPPPNAPVLPPLRVSIPLSVSQQSPPNAPVMPPLAPIQIPNAITKNIIELPNNNKSLLLHQLIDKQAEYIKLQQELLVRDKELANLYKLIYNPS